MAEQASNNDNGTLILIASSDKSQEFEISRKAAMLSSMVKSLLEEDSNTKKIPVKKIKGETLQLIVEYLKHHNGQKPEDIPKPIRSLKMEENVADKWDADYINKMSKTTAFEVILGASYMDLDSLMQLASAKIACMIKGNQKQKLTDHLNTKSL